jgi:NTE family protein
LGLPLDCVVASSCAFPGVFAPISIDGRRYMDGAVCAQRQRRPREGLRIVLTPALGQPDEIGKRFAALLEAEVKTLRDGGPNVGLIAPGAAGIKAFGPSLTDATHRFAAAFAGPCGGLNNADKIRGAWSD